MDSTDRRKSGCCCFMLLVNLLIFAGLLYCWPWVALAIYGGSTVIMLSLFLWSDRKGAGK